MSHKKTSLNEAYVATIIDAIKNRRAAVMIGSGFSKNANNGHLMPSWAELAAYLDCGTPKNSTAVSDILELAETYVAAYGRSELDKILLEKTGNKALNVTPSEIYVDLLNIPWADIFTTNYDTLLEDAANDFRRKIDYDFKEIHSIHDIAFSKCIGKTRIIKLHGSFLSHRPFIITEEDYRTYENKFAPFVNTVQQSMLENIFCLIGFSSDDPNFKHWIGWVRDNLGDNQPPIYLITASDVAAATQKYLQKKNIHVVNIGYLASKTYKTSKHYNALKGFFEKIRQELILRDSSEWKLDLPKQDSSEPWDNYYKTRKNYPGWIVPPFQYIRKLWWHFNLSRQQDIKEFNIKNFMKFYDMIWLMDKAAYPLHVYIEKIEQFLDIAVALFSNTKDLEKQIADMILQERNKHVNDQDKKQDMLEKWEHLGIIFLKYLFTTQSNEFFQEWIVKHSEFIKENGLFLLDDTIQYFQILFALGNYENTQAKELLSKWEIKSSDILLQIKYALMHNELGDHKKCIELLEICKNKVDDIKIDDKNFHNITSLMGWVSFYCTEFKKIDIDFLSQRAMSEEEKDDQTAQLEHDLATNLSIAEVQSFFQSASRELYTALAFKHDKEYFTFENNLPIVQKEKTIHSGYPSFYFALCIWSGFSDLLSFPTRIGFIRYDTKNKSNLVKLEILSNGLISTQNLASVVRGASTLIFKNESILFSRSALRLLTDKQKENLLIYLSNCISIFIDGEIGQKYDGDAINFSFEFLGRLCFVLNVEQRKAVLNLAIRLYTAHKIHFFYQEKFILFFKLVLLSQDLDILSKNIDRLFALPVIQEQHQNDITSWCQYWADPFEILSNMPTGNVLELSEEDSVKYANTLISDIKNLREKQVNNSKNNTDKIIPNTLSAELATEIQPLLDDIHGDSLKDSHRKIYYSYINRLIWVMEHAQNKILIQKIVTDSLKEVLENISQYNFAHWVALKFSHNYIAYKEKFLSRLDSYSLQDIHFSLNYPDEYHKHIFFTPEELHKIITKLKSYSIPKQKFEISIFKQPSPPDVDYITYILSTFFCNSSVLLKDNITWIEKLIESQKSYKKPYYQLEFMRLRACNTTDFDNFIYQLEDALRSEHFSDMHDACAVIWCWRFFCNESDKPQEIETMLLKAAKDCTNDKSVALLNNICKQFDRFELNKKELDILYIVLKKNLIILNDDIFNIQQAETLENILRSKCSFPQRRYYCAKVVYELVNYAYTHEKNEILEQDIVKQWIELMKKEPFSDTQNLYFLTQDILEKAHAKKEEGQNGQA